MEPSCRLCLALSLLALVLCAGTVQGLKGLCYDPDIDLPTPQLIRRHGYPAEAHVVQTADGYLLSLHRIPRPGAPAVFLQHGLLASSADWVVAGPGRALAYLLHDSGYDVWMGNVRGNTYSRNHISWSASDARFWNFSFHEPALLDLPASLDHVLGLTGQAALSYVGHSMGTTMFFAMASARPEYNAKVKAMFALAPVAFVKHIKSPIRLIAPLANDVETIAHFFGANEFLPQSKILNLLAKYGCEKVVFEKKICENVMFIFSGFDAQQFNESLLPVILSHTPAGTATKVIIHFAQEVNSGKFQYYDYGKKGNQKAYGQPTPPEYNLTQITVPVSLHVANNDWLVSKMDSDVLANKLQHKIGLFQVPLPNFNHLDFLWGKDAKELVYDELISLMKQHTEEMKLVNNEV